DAEHTRGVEVDREFEIGRLQDRQFRRLGAFEDAPDIERNSAIGIGQVGSIAHQATSFDKIARGKGCRKGVACRQDGDVDTSSAEESGWRKKQRLGFLAHQTLEGASISRPVAASNGRICSPIAAVSRSRSTGSLLVLSVGLTSTPTGLAARASSRSSWSRFATNSLLKKLTPVALPPGCLRLPTRPILTRPA